MNKNSVVEPKEKMIPESEFNTRMAEMEAFFTQKFKELEEKTKENSPEYVIEQPLNSGETSGDVRLDDYVPVISLCPMPLNLSTQGNGRGRVFKFSKFGDRKSILYRDLVDIIENHRSFVDAGFFYILSPSVIRKAGLDDVYEKILTKEKILEILNGNNKNDSISLYETANDRQKEMIIEMILQKLHEDPESIDMNIVDKIGKISKIDLIGKINFSKELLENEKEES